MSTAIEKKIKQRQTKTETKFPFWSQSLFDSLVLQIKYMTWSYIDINNENLHIRISLFAFYVPIHVISHAFFT